MFSTLRWRSQDQAIWMKEGRVFEVNEAECVACNLCLDVCPVEACITMRPLARGEVGVYVGGSSLDHGNIHAAELTASTACLYCCTGWSATTAAATTSAAR